MIKAGHITKLLGEDLSADLEALHVQKAILGVSELLEILKSYREDCTSYKHKVKIFIFIIFWLRSLKRSGIVTTLVVKRVLLLLAQCLRTMEKYLEVCEKLWTNKGSLL